MTPDLRARTGLFLGFQYPVEVAGVNFANFLRMAVNGQKREGEKILSPIAFRNKLEEAASVLGFSDELAKRALNQGFSGGEKKKAEILQLSMMRPDFAVLDEPDSGLDVDALRYIGRAINGLDYPFGLVLITHYQRILDYIKPDVVHVVVNGRIVESGDASLAGKIEQSGYESFK
jgi:Fe-S cluster assembly ATP-binding protein